MKNFLNLDENPLKNCDPILRFDKLILNEKRVKEMHEYSKDPEFFKFMEIKPSKTINETKDYLEKLIARDADGSHGGDSLYWAIIDELEDKMIGTIGFQAIKRSHASACTTMGISTKYRSKGRAIEATLSLYNYGFKTLNLHRIWAVTHESNLAVIKLHQTFGFKTEGVLRDYYIKDGKYMNGVLLSCINDEYRVETALKSLFLIKKLKIN